jgi:pyridoxine 4-dehydrogenase
MTNKTFKIGQTLEIKRIGLGTMRLTAGEGKWGMPADKENAIKVLQKAVDLGVDFFDTADMYGPEISENIIAEALYPYNSKIVIATKGGNEIFSPNNVKPNCSPTYIRKAVHDSLRRLKLERIDLYQLHTVDPKVEIEFSIEELAKLRTEGKIRFIGVSNIDMENFKRALTVTDIQTIQNRFNQNDKTSEGLIRFAEELNIAFLSYYPLGKGLLARHNSSQESQMESELTLSQQTLLWQLKQFSNLIPLPGTTSIEHLKENFSTLNYLYQ